MLQEARNRGAALAVNKRLGFSLAAYLALWAAVAGGITYGVVLAGY